MTRRILFWTHLTVGVTAGLAILVMSLTGVLLAFERQVLHLVDRDLRAVATPAGTSPRPLADLVTTVVTSTGVRPSTVIVRPGGAAAVEVTLGRERSVYVDPYTGAVLGESSTTARAFFAAVERWHRALGQPLGTRGPLRSLAAAANLLFLVLAMSGLYLWLPRTWSWTAMRPAIVFRTGLRGRARDWNWHNVAGLWCALPLIVITLSGVIMSYPWANALLFRMAGSEPPVRQERGRGPDRDAHAPDVGLSPAVAASLDRAAAVAGARSADWQTITVRVPADGDPQVAVTLDSGTGGEVEKRVDLVVDGATGRVVRERRFADQPLGQRLRGLVRFAHTGEEGGMAGQAVAAVASAGGALLVWSGLSLAVRRGWRAWLTRRPRSNAATPASSDPSVDRPGSPGVLLLALLLCGLGPARTFAADPPAAAGEVPTASDSASGHGQVGRPAFVVATFADDTVQYVFGAAYRAPFIASAAEPDGADVRRNAVESKHVDAWRYGHDTIEIAIKKSGANEPAAGGGTGALELYGVFRSSVDVNRMAGRPLVAIGPLTDIGLQAGINVQTKGTAFAPQERTFYVGPNFQFRVAGGFVNVALQLRKEWNHDGNLGTGFSYHAGFNVEPVWRIPFRLGPARLAFAGFADYNTPKGHDAAGRPSRSEFVARPLVTIDLSRAVGQPSRVLEAAFGVEYWRNMYGLDESRIPGTKQLTPVVTLAVHLPLRSTR